MSETPPLRLPSRAASAHKGTFGARLLVGGSRGMSGSIAMSSIAALHAGSGLVTTAIPDRCLETVASFHPAIMTSPMPDDGLGRFSMAAVTVLSELLPASTVVGCGPGMTTQPGSIRIVERLLQASEIPRVFDADAINSLPQIDRFAAATDLGTLVLTPHPGEFQNLSGVSAADRAAQIEAAAELADRSGIVIVLKGGPSVVVSRGEVWTNGTGNPGMATAGSGDVLTGVITSLLGQGLSARDAARLGVWVHGRAGDIAAEQIGQPGMTAVAILAAIPQVAASVTGKATANQPATKPGRSGP